jgi:hypothetical protein
MTQNGTIMTADTGKVFRRITDQMVYSNEINLGYTYYIGGVLQNPPHQDVASDFEEIDAPVETEDINTNQ